MENPILNLSSCINPNEYEPWELEAYADGEVMPQVHAHLEQCPYCRSQLQRNKYFDSGLTVSLYRHDCPSLDKLFSYLSRGVSEEERSSIGLHLQSCPLCAEESEQFIKFDQSEDLATVHSEPDSIFNKLTGTLDGASQHVSMVIASLISTPKNVVAAPAFRGAQQETQLLFAAEDVIISLSLNPEPKRTYEISGQILNTDFVEEDARFRLVSEDHEFIGPVNAAGVFNIVGTPKGLYQLTIYLISQNVVIPKFSI